VPSAWRPLSEVYRRALARDGRQGGCAPDLSRHPTDASLGRPATGKPIAFRAIDILRVEDGRIVEAGHVEDNYNSTLMRQFDAAPLAGHYRERP
jgi:hypothetical protein